MNVVYYVYKERLRINEVLSLYEHSKMGESASFSRLKTVQIFLFAFFLAIIVFTPCFWYSNSVRFCSMRKKKWQ